MFKPFTNAIVYVVVMPCFGIGYDFWIGDFKFSNTAIGT
jgi:hypothetical protein